MRTPTVSASVIAAAFNEAWRDVLVPEGMREDFLGYSFHKRHMVQLLRMNSSIWHCPFPISILQEISFVVAKEPAAHRQYHIRSSTDELIRHRVESVGEEDAARCLSFASKAGEHLRSIGEPEDDNMSIQHLFVLEAKGLYA